MRTFTVSRRRWVETTRGQRLEHRDGATTLAVWNDGRVWRNNLRPWLGFATANGAAKTASWIQTYNTL